MSKITGSSNIESLVLYHALLSDAKESLKYWQAQPADAIDRQENINNYSTLIAAHESEIIRLNNQIENAEKAKSDLQKFLDTMRNILETLKEVLPAEVKKWISLLISIAEKLLSEL